MSQLKSLLDIEEEAQLWDAEVNGLHLWAAIRTTVLSTRLYRTFGHSRPHASRRRIQPLINPGKWSGYVRFLRWLTRQRNTKYNTMIFKDVMTRSGDIDRIYQAYYDELPSSLVLETNFTGLNPLLNEVGQAELHTEDIIQAWTLFRRSFNRLSPSSRDTINSFADEIAYLFEINDLKADLQSRMIRFITLYHPLTAFIEQHIQPRITSSTVFLHMASYSNRYGLLTRILHDLGYTVIEPQHGTVHSEHFAYQFPSSCFEKDHVCQQYLPDIMLTFGEFWHQAATVPYTCIPIGYAYLNDVASRLRSEVTEDPTQVLIISQGIVTTQMVEIAKQLATAHPSKTFIFKLHPQEINFTDRYADLYSISNVQVIGQGNVYALIAACTTIIGYSSTVLYETLAFGQKRVFVLDNDSLEGEIGTRFQTIDELLTVFDDPTAGGSQIDPTMLWAINPRDRLRAFLAEHPL